MSMHILIFIDVILPVYVRLVNSLAVLIWLQNKMKRWRKIKIPIQRNPVINFSTEMLLQNIVRNVGKKPKKTKTWS